MDQSVIVVMPAYNAAKTWERTYRDLPEGVVDKIILVDDVSQDETVEIAQRLGLKTIVHVQNKGYGGQSENVLPGSSRGRRRDCRDASPRLPI